MHLCDSVLLHALSRFAPCRHWGDVSVTDASTVRFMVGDKKAFEMPLSAISQATHLKVMPL